LLITIIFAYVYQELNFDRFHTNNNNIYRINAGGYGVTPLCFADKLENKIPEVKNTIRFSSGEIQIKNGKGEVEVGKIYYTDNDVFQVFSFKLLLGNTAFVLKEPFSIVISKSTAKKIFGSDSPIGKTIKDKDDAIYTVTGVMEDIPYESHIQANAFVSIETLRHLEGEINFDCGAWSILTYVGLTDKSVPEVVETKINSVLENFKMGTSDGKIPLKLQPLKKIYFDGENNKYDGSRHGNIQTVFLYLAISVLILSIVIINYINLSTATSAGRLKEIAIKKINGAKHSQIIIQSVFEAIATAIISFALAILLIELFFTQLCTILNLHISESFNRLELYLLFFIGVILVGLIAGLFPGIYLCKTKVIKVLKNETVFRSSGYQRKILLVIQMLIVATLLNSTFTINSQINYIFKKDIGFNYENVISFKLNEELESKNDLLKDKLIENPEILNISFSNNLIGDGFTKAPIGNDDNLKMCNLLTIDPDFIELYDIKIVDGRDFSWNLSTDLSNSCIINEETCRVFGYENPISNSLNNKEIIGVVKDFNFTSLHNQIEPLIVFCGKGGNTIQIQLTDENQNNTLEYISGICKDISPDFDFNYIYLKDRIKSMYKSELNLKSSFRFYSFITFTLALLGLFGLTLFLIKKKTKDVSLRKLFGAKPYNTLKLLASEQIVYVLTANILSIPITYFIMNKWLNNFQYRVDIDYFDFLKTLTITISLTILAVSFIVLRVHKVNLIETLRND
jgi:putative ABC transport system permease protein